MVDEYKDKYEQLRNYVLLVATHFGIDTSDLEGGYKVGEALDYDWKVSAITMCREILESKMKEKHKTKEMGKLVLGLHVDINHCLEELVEDVKLLDGYYEVSDVK